MSDYDRPVTLNIQGTTWDLDWKQVPPTNLPLEEWGECDDGKLTISLYINGQRTHDVDTFLHELCHAAESVGMVFGDDKHTAHSRIRQLARFLAQVLVDNDLIKL